MQVAPKYFDATLKSVYLVLFGKKSSKMANIGIYNREPETVFVPHMFVPENRQSWQRVGCLLISLFLDSGHPNDFFTP